VLPTYPDSTEKSKINFKLDGIVRESMNIELESDAEIVTDFEFDFQCEFVAVSDIEQIASLYAADVLKINTTLTLNGTEVLPAPEVCAYENGVCDENNQLKMGQYYKIDYSNQVDSTLSFRIESIWAGRNEGEKIIRLVENGCPEAFFPSDKIDSFGLTYEWAAFKFRNQDEIHFTIQVDLCDPDDLKYCKGATDCANGVGNQELFDQLLENDTVRRRRSADENDHDYQKADDITVSVKTPENAKTVEDVVDEEEIIRISADDFVAMADDQQAAFSFAFTFILAFLL